MSYIYKMSLVTCGKVMKEKCMQAGGQYPVILLAIFLHQMSARNIMILYDKWKGALVADAGHTRTWEQSLPQLGCTVLPQVL
jgi:hypothetical protein